MTTRFFWHCVSSTKRSAIACAWLRSYRLRWGRTELVRPGSRSPTGRLNCRLTSLAVAAAVRQADGRVYFHCPGLFKVAFSLTGAQDEGQQPADEAREDIARGGTWYLLSLDWDYCIGGREGVEDLQRGQSSMRSLLPPLIAAVC
jgi:hypothetical protein